MHVKEWQWQASRPHSMSWAPSRGLTLFMAKGPQGLLNAGTLSRGLLAVSVVTVEVAQGGAFFSPASCWAL
jgi:hypothetical protein